MEFKKRAMIISEAGVTASSGDRTTAIRPGEEQSAVFLQPPWCVCVRAYLCSNDSSLSPNLSQFSASNISRL